MSSDNRSLRRLTADEMAGLLTQTGLGPVTTDEIDQVMKAGAPKNQDGSFHLIHFGAWLCRQLSEDN